MKTVDEIIKEIEKRKYYLEKTEFAKSHVSGLRISFSSAIATLESLLQWIKEKDEE